MGLDPRMEKLYADRAAGTRWIALASGFIAVLLVFKFASAGWICISLSILAALVINIVANAVYLLYLQVKHFGRKQDAEDDFAEFTEEELKEIIHEIRNEPKSLHPEMMRVHARPEKRLATWMDADIFEWIEFIDDDNVVRRYEYETVVSAQQR